MTMVVNATATPGMRVDGMLKRGTQSAAAVNAEMKIEDGYHYRTIGTASALLVAIAASILVTALLRISL